jgi:hypothetical protein
MHIYGKLRSGCSAQPVRMAKERFVKGVKIAGATAAVVGIVYLAFQAADDDENFNLSTCSWQR